MIRTLRTLMLAGLGALDFTEEKLRAVFDDLVHRGEVTELDAKHLLATWSKHAGERRDELDRQVRAIVREELEKQNIPRRDELDAVTQHVTRIERQVIPLEDVPAR
jgi:polyhydroxyalkanoate synthesis regulator phasin